MLTETAVAGIVNVPVPASSALVPFVTVVPVADQLSNA